MNNIFVPMSSDAKRIVQNSVNSTYNLFVKRCADGRSMEENAIREIAEGRVWTGRDALSIGLVDALGGTEEAIDKAKELANIEQCEIVKYPVKRNLLEEIVLSMTETSALVNKADRLLNTNVGMEQSVMNLMNLNGETTIQTLLPYYIVFE